MAALPLVMIGFWVFAVYFVIKFLISLIPGRKKLCKNCLYLGVPKTYVKGSLAIEIILWFCLFLPGIIYSIWRISSSYKACPACGRPHMIPLESPAAQRLLPQIDSSRHDLPHPKPSERAPRLSQPTQPSQPSNPRKSPPGTILAGRDHNGKFIIKSG